MYFDDDIYDPDPDDYSSTPDEVGMFSLVDGTDKEFDEFEDYFRKKDGSELLSLQDICLFSITKNLPRFNLAFSTTEDSKLRRNLQFLQRFHSSYLIKATTSCYRNFNESYLDFLLNEYVKELDIGTFYGCNWDKVIKRFAEIGHSFQKVSFTFPNVSDFEKSVGMFPEFSDSEKNVDFVNKVVNKVVCNLPNVEILDLSSFCYDSTLEIIASSCLLLKELHINNCSVTDNGLKVLCQGNDDNASRLNLKHLSLQNVSDINEGIFFLLKNMPSLEVIMHRDLPYILHNMHKDSLTNTFERKFNLTSLHLNVCARWEDTPSITDILTLFIDVCPHINEVFLPFESKEHLDLCFRFPDLESFTANYTASTNQYLDLNEFLKSKGEKLRILNLIKFSLSATILVKKCQKLEKLDLQNITFQYLEPGTTLRPLNNLRELFLGSFHFGDALVQHSVMDILNSSPNIEKLSLLYCKFEDNGEFITSFSKICENESLKYLKFIHCDIDEAFLQSILLTCPNLKVLVVDSCERISFTERDYLFEIVKSLNRKIRLIFEEGNSEISSIDSGDDIYDNHSEYDSEGYDNYDSDNLYYGYDSDEN